MEGVYEHEGVKVRYKLREAKQDRQHLVVVFAAVLPGQHDFYGFDGNTLDHVKGAVLWIKDSFDGHNSYYMCAGMDFTIERAVSALIDSTLQSLGLTPADCTLLGASKGATAALHLGLKYDYRNIVASVPQTKVGTYVRQQFKETFAYMAGPDADSSEAKLNEYVPELIAAPRSLAKNIYIASSEADPEFKVHIKPVLDGLSRFENFNLLLTDSTLVTAHPDVTPYNVPFILSTLYALCEGLEPRYGMVRNGNGKQDREAAREHFANNAGKAEPVAGFHWVRLQGDRLSFWAYGAALGEETTEEPSTRPMLLAVNGSDSHAFELDAMADKSLNSKLYRKYFCDYSWAGLKTPLDRGLSLYSLPAGTFDLKASFTSRSGHHQAPLAAKTAQKMTGVSAGYAYQLDASPARTHITKTLLDAPVPADGVFTFTNLSVDAQKLFIRGVFAVPREEMRAWNEGVFALTLRNESTAMSFQLGASPVPATTPLPETFDAETYAWASFSTLGGRGIDLTTVVDGHYECFVTFIRNGRAYTGGERFSLAVAQETLELGRVFSTAS
ncbi:hypothetical protein [Arthrobacter mobilis]|uniref:Uncharacterized protein n=1 Tax=Arthrobacter mobilis TaxID=2724944 RepID=A0A7X6QMR8_9MICC|nr:hypothetical protein [Arthrobacter mobilis]NKX56898.1 hypothetical protein [Arthrobacter mobilis]